MSKIIGCKFDKNEIIVYGRSKKPVDIHKRRLEEEEAKRVKKDDVIIVDTFFTNNAKFYVDASCFDDNKISSNVKWSVVYQHAFFDASTKGGEIPPELWALNEGDTSIKYLGMNKHYKKGESLTVNLLGDSASMYYYGYVQQVVVFTDKPEDGFTFYIIPISRPCINFAHFENSEKNWQYGEAVNLTTHFHNLCSTETETLYRQVFVVENNDSNKTITAEDAAEIDFDDLNDVSVWASGEEEMKKISPRGGGVNEPKEYNILIDYENWRKGEVKEKQFSVIAVVYRKESGFFGSSDKVVKFQNFLANPTTNLYQYDSKTLSIKDIDIKASSISSRIIVQKDFMSEILAKREIEKTNMIQYIGDIEYSRKENNPCAFSLITVNIGGKDIEIFNEYKLNKKVDDETNRFVDIVSGDKEKKKVTVTAKFKKNKDAKPEAVRTEKNKHKCEKILNDGKPHNGIHDVFKMGWIVGQWVPSKDPALFAERYMKMLGIKNKPSFYHPSNGGTAPKLEWNKPDQDAKGMEAHKEEQEKYEIVTVAGIQGLTDKDYTIDEGSDSITLELQYIYNKMYNSRISYYLYEEQKYLQEGILSDNFKNLWVVDYLLKWVKNEPMEQIYFVPVTTCRYPNQIAQIRVFPDMKWVLNFNYNIETPLYYKANTALTEHYSGFNEGEINSSNNNKRKEILDKKVSNGLQHYVGRKTTFGLHVECEVSGEDDVINLGDEFGEKFREMCAPLFWMVDTLDNDLGVSDAREEQANLLSSPSTKKGLWDRLNKLPMEFELNPPSIGIGLGIGYGSSKDGRITYELDGRLIADPIIGATVKLDILALGSEFKPWGAVIDALDLVSWLANLFSGGSVELEYELYFELTAKINLVGTGSKDGETKPANITYNFADKKFRGDIALQGYLEGKFHMSAFLKIKVKAEKGKDAVQYRTENDDKKAFELGVEITAKSFVTLTIGKNFGENNNWDSDFYFSGVHLFIKVKAGFKGIDDDLKLIPSLDKKINIFKDGEYK